MTYELFMRTHKGDKPVKDFEADTDAQAFDKAQDVYDALQSHNIAVAYMVREKGTERVINPEAYAPVVSLSPVKLTPKMLVDALEDGVKWARGLKVGDKFLGARPEAEARYTDATLQRAFTSGALDVLDRGRVVTDLDGVLVEDVIR